MAQPLILDVKIMTPKEVIYQGQALAVSSQNSQGKFDILPLHTNFITYIEKFPITILKIDKTPVVFNFSQAIIHYSENQVAIYAEPQG